MIDSDVSLRHLELVAAVVAGRWMEITEGEPTSHCTANEIIVPADVSRGAARAPILAQAALAGAGSLEVAWSAGLHYGRINRVADRYIALEVPRALRFRAPALPGLDELARSVGADWPQSNSAEESLRRARGREPLPRPPAWFGTLAPSVPIVPVAEQPNRAMDAEEELQTPPSEPAATMNPLAAELAKLLADYSPDIDDNRLLRRLRGGRRAATGSTSSEAGPKARSSVRRRAGDPGAALWRSADGGADRTRPWRALVGLQRGPSRRYPEFDAERLTMQPDHCTVYDIEATARDGAPAPPQLADAELRRRLARVVLVPAPSRRRVDGDELDLEATIDARATLTATGQADDRLWIAPRPRRPELAVLVLVDLSGSVSSSSAGSTTHRRQLEFADVIADALQAVGARVAVHGFRSQDRRNVELVNVARFGTPWDASARGRLHGCEPCGFTRLGAAIRRAGDIIEEEAGMPRRVLVVVSDGVAYDTGYEGAYAEADTRQALREAKARAIAPLCITVGADTGEAALARVFGPVPRVRARAVGDLRAPLAGLIRDALR